MKSDIIHTGGNLSVCHKVHAAVLSSAGVSILASILGILCLTHFLICLERSVNKKRKKDVESSLLFEHSYRDYPRQSDICQQ